MRPHLIEIAHATLAVDGKGEDDVLQRAVGDGEFLLAVADGLSLHSGRVAAQLAVDVLRKIDPSGGLRSVFERFREALPASGDNDGSQTTVTCGLLKTEERSGLPYLILDYFAIGDSPIWRVVRTPDGRYPVQRYVVHGSPYPAETAKVYATVRPHHENTIQGPVAFGRAEISVGEVLIICTDGVPEREVFARSQGQDSMLAAARPSLCDWLFQSAPYTNAGIAAVLDAYAATELLYDDATIIAARICRMAVTEGSLRKTSSVEDVTEAGEDVPISLSDASDVSSASPEESPNHQKPSALNPSPSGKHPSSKRPKTTTPTKHRGRR